MLKYKVGVVSYLNSLPFVKGLQASEVINQTELIVQPPAVIAQMLLEEKIDMGLVPVAILSRMKTYHINTNYCIGANKQVYSVCIFSNEPIENCHTLLLDSHSRTSVALARILLKEYFKVTPEVKPSYAGYENELMNGVAGVVIGDRTFPLHKKYKYCYDLATCWHELTSLPFVFAAWISRNGIDSSYLEQFSNALDEGINMIDKIALEVQPKYNDVDVRKYLTQNISFDLNEGKRKGLELFLEKLSLLALAPNP
jgi:chorismate dehydratase